MSATISEKPMTTAYGIPRKRLLAWLQESNAHGLSYQVFWLEDGDRPEVGEWIRAPWLDEMTQMTFDPMLDPNGIPT